MLRQCSRVVRYIVPTVRKTSCKYSTNSIVSKLFTTTTTTRNIQQHLTPTACLQTLRLYSTTEDVKVEPEVDGEAVVAEAPAAEEVAEEVASEEVVAEEIVAEEIVEEAEEVVEEELSLVEQERANNLAAQEERANTIFIRGLEPTDDQEEKEEQIFNLFSAIGCDLGGIEIENIRHNIDNGFAWCTFAERRNVNYIFSRARNIATLDEYKGVVNIGDHQTPAFGNIQYHLRKLRRSGKVGHVTSIRGIPRMKPLGSDNFVDITHIQDLVDMGLLESVDE